MFTGIITGVGRIVAVHALGSSSTRGKRLTIACPPHYLDDVGPGDSGGRSPGRGGFYCGGRGLALESAAPPTPATVFVGRVVASLASAIACCSGVSRP